MARPWEKALPVDSHDYKMEDTKINVSKITKMPFIQGGLSGSFSFLLYAEDIVRGVCLFGMIRRSW